MKKTLLLSVVASTMIMAGGDIAPVEPVVAPAAVSAWDFSGNAVVYYQTDDSQHITSRGVTAPVDDALFSKGASAADAGLQLRAMNSDVVAGIGAGFEVSALATLGLENWMVSDVMQSTATTGSVTDQITGGWLSQAYLTYGIANTSIKAGRQELPQSLSPFAYSEDWNVFKNTFDGVLVVNTDLPNTTLVGAYVYRANANGRHADMSDFSNLNDQDALYMLTAQNKSIENLTLTGSWYYGSEYLTTDDLNILWGDAAYDAGSFNVAIQGGSVMHDAITNTEAFGGKIGATVSDISLGLAYSNVNDGTFGMFQVGGTTSALYTNTVVNQLLANALERDADKFVASAAMGLLGGNITGVYAYTDSAVTDTTNEFDLVYSMNVTDDLGLTAAYVYIDTDVADADLDGNAGGSANFVRLVANYKF
jgi:hypothetical protein